MHHISGLLRPERGEVTRSSIELEGQAIDNFVPHGTVLKGMVQVFKGHRVFAHFNAEDNLIAGAHIVLDIATVRQNIGQVCTFFRHLKERRTGEMGYLSVVERQMLVIGHALISNPKRIMLDEPSLRLAPIIIEKIVGIIQRMREEAGVTNLLVEQNATLAMSVADHRYVMENDSIVMVGPAKDLADNSDITEVCRGIGETGSKRSCRDVKRYRRRKRGLS